ncbi:kinase-like domain-containing protein [Lophiotrema nucula]|uniref:Kinase-like domain-containing protein n=1 Tax=Lophiotrema nucula TaxID=690887 RepID=A0A6A5ZI58_9PLEO|nr:kinase-like domain-containing protein [Lophiotrema nucula]
MAAPQSAPARLEDFKQRIAEYTVRPIHDGGRPYVRTTKLLEWMRLDSAAEDLLEAAYEATHSRSTPIVLPRILDEGSDRCLTTFAMLLELDLGYMIDKVRRKDIVDRVLPLPLRELQDRFVSLDTVNGSNIADRFHQLQWKYCPLNFYQDMDKEISDHVVVPICRKQVLGDGGQARVFQIAVQDEFIDSTLSLALREEGSRYEDAEFGLCFQIAMKTFEDSNMSFFEDEKAAFDMLRGNPGIVRCIGSYGQTEAGTPRKHILMEYAQYDLMSVFMYRLPPVIPPELRSFWGNLVEIVDALSHIHHLRTKFGDYHGWHNDVKPGNILAIDGHYKLSDPALAVFQKRQDSTVETVPMTVVRGHTRTYGAPEYDLASPGPEVRVTQSVDLWALGCVFSMAATWLVLGFQGVHQFGLVRQRAIESNARGQAGLLNRGAGDWFHNGTELLPEVKQWHQYLRYAARRTDVFTTRILDLVEHQLLVVEERRTSASSLYQALQKLLDDSPENRVPAELQSLMVTLSDIETEVPQSQLMLDSPQTTELFVKKLPEVQLSAPLQQQDAENQSSHSHQEEGAQANPVERSPRPQPIAPRNEHANKHSSISVQPDTNISAAGSSQTNPAPSQPSLQPQPFIGAYPPSRELRAGGYLGYLNHQNVVRQQPQRLDRVPEAEPLHLDFESKSRFKVWKERMRKDAVTAPASWR